MMHTLHTSMGVRAVVTLAAPCGSTVLAPAETFEITTENLSPNVLTPVALVSGIAAFDLFDDGDAQVPPARRTA